MKLKDPEQKFVTKYFVKKPVFFVAILLAGPVLFFLCSQAIQIPVYHTFDGTVRAVGDRAEIVIEGFGGSTQVPIFVYTNRDEQVEEITEYRVEGSTILLQNRPDAFSDRQKVKIDVCQNESSLWQMVFRNGGISNEKEEDR